MAINRIITQTIFKFFPHLNTFNIIGRSQKILLSATKENKRVYILQRSSDNLCKRILFSLLPSFLYASVSEETRLISIFIPPVPYFKTFSATVFSAKGFRAIQIGSCAGLRAVPQPSHSELPLVVTKSYTLLFFVSPFQLFFA